MNGSAVQFDITGSGGAPAEADGYYEAEIFTTGSGADTLQLSGNVLTTNLTTAAPTLRFNGGGGNDAFNITAVHNAQGVPYAHAPVVADGGDGNDLFDLFSADAAATTAIGDDVVRTTGPDANAATEKYSGATIDPGSGFDRYEVNLELVPSYTMPSGLDRLDAVHGHSVTGNELDNTISLTGTGNLTVNGLGGNDSLGAQGGPATILGGSGNDSLAGSSFPTVFDGGTGNDVITGSGGQDVVTYAGRSEAITATLTVSLSIDTSGTPTVYTISSVGDVTIAGGEHDTLQDVLNVIGGTGNDTLTINVTPNTHWADVTTPFASRNAFSINRGAGNDTLTASTAYDGNFSDVLSAPITADGGTGKDQLETHYGRGVTLAGSAGDDSFRATGDDSTVPAIVAGTGVDSFLYSKNIRVAYTIPTGL